MVVVVSVAVVAAAVLLCVLTFLLNAPPQFFDFVGTWIEAKIPQASQFDCLVNDQIVGKHNAFVLLLASYL